MPRFAANLSFLFTERPFAERFGAAAEAGFEAVECLFPYEQAAETTAALLRAHDLTLALFNAPPGDWAAGERGLAALPGDEDRFTAAVAEARAYAAVARPGRIHLMAGLAEGLDARATYVANLRGACAAAPDLAFTVEPINGRDMPGYHLRRLADALDVIEAVGAPNLSLQLDLYHRQIEEGDVTRAIEAAAPVLGHVQVAGVPDRNEPDGGELAFGRLMDALDRVGFAGFVGCEYRPAGRTEDGLGWFAPFRRR
ncbi:MAG: hydroxypyruvate isomerase [Rhodobacteraceae bacterium]|nr:MAG: hydroxypyruvate isomerase [Paracoccaceae bacterium]